MVDSNDFSIEEKVMATKDYMSRAQEMTVEKEKQRIQAEYDRETVRLTSLMFGQHDDINEVLKRNRYRIQTMTSKVAADLLAMKGR